jgi:uncharacterized short protein YbdD (DUF466 family)
VHVNIDDLTEDGQLPTGLPRYDDYLAHFYAVHRAQGYTVFYPCAVAGCKSVFWKWGNYVQHMQQVHGRTRNPNTKAFQIKRRDVASAVRAF